MSYILFLQNQAEDVLSKDVFSEMLIHRMVEVEGNHKKLPGAASLPKKDHLELVVQDHIQSGFNISKEEDFT